MAKALADMSIQELTTEHRAERAKLKTAQARMAVIGDEHARKVAAAAAAEKLKLLTAAERKAAKKLLKDEAD